MAEAKPANQMLVDALPQGILGLSPSGEVSQMNPAAGRILSLDPQKAVGLQFSELFADRLAQGEELFKTIAAALAKGTTLTGLVIPLNVPEGGTSYIDLTVSPLSGGGCGVLLADISLHEAARLDKQKECNLAAGWAARLEQEKRHLERALKSSLRLRLWAALAVILIFAGLGYYVWTSTHLRAEVDRELQPSAAGGPAGAYTVQPQPLSSSISLAGSIQPSETINLLSPFDGRVLEKHFEYGQKVEQGALMLKLDTSDLELKLRDAMVDAIKAQENYRKLQDWKNSDAVLEAQREVEKANNDMQVTQQKLDEAKMLFDKGIIPRDEYRSLKEQVQNQKISLSTIKDHLRAAMAQGQKENLLMARLQKENAQAKLADIKRQIKQGNITASVVGVVIKPTGGTADKKAMNLEVGSQVTKGQPLLALGNLERLSVATQVGELNVAKLKKGQKVTVTSFACSDLTLQGVIEAVSDQAMAQGDPSSPPAFQVIVTTSKLTPAQRGRLRLGMSADLEVQVYYVPQALTVPIAAVHKGPQGGNMVTLRQADGKKKETPVKTGVTTPDAVEITQGLKAGDVVLLPAAPPGS